MTKDREILLMSKINVTEWMIDFIEKYLESSYEYIESGGNCKK
jgi:hypothetical protein